MEQQQSVGGIAGVYKGTRTIVIGAGATRRKSTTEAFVYAEQTSEAVVAVQPLNNAFLPVSPVEEVPLDEFLARYTPEPEIFRSKTLPAISAMRKTLAKAERLRGQGETYSAEYEFQNALKLDDTNIRANYGLGLTYLDRGEHDKAETVLRKLVHLETAFANENKHLFNEFGIKLRKSGMLEQALAYYGRAMTLAPKDENLLYNIARVLYDKKDFAKALQFAGKALALNSELEAAAHLVKVIRKETGDASLDPSETIDALRD
ncbi:tetratricopeptide repeat protein [Megalodesulfovibrio paquesii]